MKRALLPLWLIMMGVIVCTTTVTNAQSLGPASIRPDQAEIHSVVVDLPRIISLPPVSSEAWEAWWANLPLADHLDGQRLTTEQVAQNRLQASPGTNVDVPLSLTVTTPENVNAWPPSPTGYANSATKEPQKSCQG